jgi:hypothetical protein
MRSGGPGEGRHDVSKAGGVTRGRHRITSSCATSPPLLREIDGDRRAPAEVKIHRCQLTVTGMQFVLSITDDCRAQALPFRYSLL